MKSVGVAMSGGVDSSAAALLLKNKGYNVFGISMRLFEPSEFRQSSFGSCCSLEDIHMAKKAARRLGIPHYTLDLKDAFAETVIHNFVEEYASGKTPNPCIVCNRIIKFEILLKKIRAMGADYLATGHYIRKKKIGKNYVLYRGKDNHKDQSYFLYNLTQEELRYLLFPVGGYTKQEIRAIAKKYNLPNADKEESQEICFVEDRKYPEFIKKNSSLTIKPGIICNREGKKIGTHKGFVYYTVGQRKGLTLNVRGPKFVLNIDPAKNIITAGDKDETYTKHLNASDIFWVSGTEPKDKSDIKAQIRYRHKPARVDLHCLKQDNARIIFSTPQNAITPGQAVVFYKGSQMLGGGTITALDN